MDVGVQFFRDGVGLGVRLEGENGPGDHVSRHESVRVLFITQGAGAVPEHIEGADPHGANSHGKPEDRPRPGIDEPRA